MTLFDGSRTIELLNFGRGNTRGDAVVYLPKERVVMTGDLLVYPVPFAFDAYLSEWIAALHAIRSLDATYIIPGHGAPQQDTKYLELVTRLLTAIRDQTRQAVADHLTLAQAIKRFDLRRWHPAFAHGDTTVAAMFDSYIPAAIESGYKEAKRATDHHR
jgi:glyoxylase-like metal-dependent hydrolase (beta-lactamase superfamily II)